MTSPEVPALCAHCDAPLDPDQRSWCSDACHAQYEADTLAILAILVDMVLENAAALPEPVAA